MLPVVVCMLMLSLTGGILLVFPWGWIQENGKETEMALWKNSPDYQHFTLWMRQQMGKPLRDVLLVSTHNSYNARSYQWGLRYADPNQLYSLSTQVLLGARMLELDVHAVFGDLRLSHARPNHQGAWPADRPFREALKEIHTLVQQANPKEDLVLFIYIEDHMENQYDKAITLLEEELGQLWYRAEEHFWGNLPSLTMQQVRDAGKHIVILTDRRGECHIEWCRRVFRIHWRTLPEDLPEARESTRNGMIRAFEDRTLLGKIIGTSRPFLDPRVLSWNVSLNVLSIDFIVPHDPRVIHVEQN